VSSPKRKTVGAPNPVKRNRDDAKDEKKSDVGRVAQSAEPSAAQNRADDVSNLEPWQICLIPELFPALKRARQT
jgi:hypothetical protein